VLDPKELFRDLICFMPEYGPALAMAWFCGSGGWVGNFPFLRECAPYLATHFPGDWRRWRGTAPDDFLDGMEAGTLLTADELVAAVKHAGSKPKSNGYRPSLEQEAAHVGS
jgi:hypothetical protein